MGVWNFVKNYDASAIDSLKTLLRAEIAAASLAAVPIGTMLPYAGGEVPEGFLLCNGASLSRTEYPELFAAIGDRWGSDSSSTFKLPDTHHRFFEGTTVLSEIGQYVQAGLPNIAGQASWYRGCYEIRDMSGSLSVVKYGISRTANSDDQQPGDVSISLNASKSSSLYGSSTTVQVSAVFGQYLIRYC